MDLRQVLRSARSGEHGTPVRYQKGATAGDPCCTGALFVRAAVKMGLISPLLCGQFLYAEDQGGGGRLREVSFSYANFPGMPCKAMLATAFKALFDLSWKAAKKLARNVIVANDGGEFAEAWKHLEVAVNRHQDEGTGKRCAKRELCWAA